MENWVAAIPLVSAFTAVFTAGVAWQKLRNQDEKIAALERRLQEQHDRSAKAQGERLEELGKDLSRLQEWRAELRGEERARLRTAAGGVPIQRDE